MPTIKQRCGQSGNWWVINTAPTNNIPYYWTGHLDKNGHPMLSFDPSRAAQFDSKESAEFQATILGVPSTWNWQAENHGWS